MMISGLDQGNIDWNVSEGDVEVHSRDDDNDEEDRRIVADPFYRGFSVRKDLTKKPLKYIPYKLLQQYSVYSHKNFRTESVFKFKDYAPVELARISVGTRPVLLCRGLP